MNHEEEVANYLATSKNALDSYAKSLRNLCKDIDNFCAAVLAQYEDLLKPRKEEK